MMSLSKRNWVLVVAAAVVIVAVVAVIVFSQVGGGDLFGAANLRISPSNSKVAVGGTVVLFSRPIASCSWSVENPEIARISGSIIGDSVTLAGVAPGTTTVSAQCGFTSISASITVTARN